MGFLHWISTKKSVEMAQPHMSRVGWRSKIGDCWLMLLILIEGGAEMEMEPTTTVTPSA